MRPTILTLTLSKRLPSLLESREPRAESREPRAESREPRAESREPRAESREPRAESREPRAESREPRAESREPRAESREPRAESREPRAESREPRAESREPRAESREPRAESREPRAESREPRAESREPRAESREPESREPRAESREPRAESREPRAESRSLRLPRAPGAWRAAACALATAFVLLLGAGDAEAQRRIELVSNHGDPFGAYPSTTDLPVNRDHAQQFTTGDSPTGYTLTTVSPLIKKNGAAPTWTVSIHEDSAGAPGTSLGTLGKRRNPWGTSSPVQHDAPGSGINVDANTKYWVVFDVGTTSSTYRVHVTASDAEVSDDLDGGWSIANTGLRRSASATTWSGATSNTKAMAIAIYGHAKDVTKPGRPGAKVNGATVKLYFNERLKESATPSPLDFWFHDPRGNRTFRPLGAPEVSSNTVTIQVVNTNAALGHDDELRLQYTPPSSTANRLQDRSGNFVDAIPRWLNVVNVTPPAISSATVDDLGTLVLTFDGELWEKEVPRASAFTVSRTRSGTTTTVPLTEPNPVAVRGRTVTLSLAEAVLSTDTVTVAYAAPTEPSMGAKLRDADNDQLSVPGFTGQSVTNLSSSWTPRFSSAVVNGVLLTVTFDGNLKTGSNHTPPASAFAATATPPGGTARTISVGRVGGITANRVALFLVDAVDRSERVTVSYTLPSTHRLQGTNNNQVPSFRSDSVTNNTPGTPAPAFASAWYASSVITVNFDGPFTGCANLIAWSFKVDGRLNYPLAVRCKGRSVEIVPDPLSDVPQIEAARSLTVSYHRGMARLAARSNSHCHPPRGCRPNSTQLQGTDGSDVASFTDQPVSGLKPRLVSAEVDGATLTLTFDETLNPDSRVYHWMFNVTVNGARRGVVTGGSPLVRGGVAIAGKTVRLTLQSAVATGDTVKVRYERGGLRGASGIYVDSFPDQAVTNYTGVVRDLWSPELTVGTSRGSFRGCADASASVSERCSERLTENSFTRGGHQVVRIEAIALANGNVLLFFALDNPIESGWTLHVDSLRLSVTDADLSDGGKTASWTRPSGSFAWTNGQKVSRCA